MRYTVRGSEVLDYGRVIVRYSGKGSEQVAREDADERNIGPSEAECQASERRQMGLTA